MRAAVWREKMRSPLLIILFLASGTAAAQNGAPDAGWVYNTKQMSSLAFDCQRRGEALECDFTQTSVRKKVSPKDVSAEIAKEWETNKKTANLWKKENCDELAKTEKALRGVTTSVTAELREAMENFEPREREDAANGVAALLNFCRSPTEANALKFAEVKVRADARSCYVSSRSFKQTFRRVDATTWASSDGPSGHVVW